MTIRDSRYKLQKLNMSLRNADLNQFQPRLRALTDYLEENKYCKTLTGKLDRNDPRYEGWAINLGTTGAVNLNFSEKQRASLGYQAISHFIGKDSNDIIGLTHFLTSDRHLNSHVRAFYDTFAEPLCDWLGEQLEHLESQESPSETPMEEVEQFISRGEELLKNAEFDENGGLIQDLQNIETEWISDIKSSMTEHLGKNDELYKDFDSVGVGVVYPLRRDYKEKHIEQFKSEMGKRLAYLSSFRKNLAKKNQTKTTSQNITPKEDIEKALSFVKNDRLRQILVRDLFDAQQATSHKSIVVLCGGVVEAVLIYKLSQGSRKAKATAEFTKKYPNARTPNDINSWSFEQVIFVSKQVKMIDEGLRSAFDSIRNFRNFVHPYREVTSPSSPDRHMADIAKSGAFHLLGLNK